MKKVTFLKTTLAIAMVGALSACSSIGKEVNQNIKDANKITSGIVKSQTDLKLDDLYEINPKGVFVDKNPIDTLSLDTKQDLPKSFKDTITVNDSSSVTIKQLAPFVSKVTGLKVITQTELLDGSVAFSTDATADDTGNNGGAATFSKAGDDKAVLSKVLFSGSKKAFLDFVASKLNISWRYVNNQVEFFKYETKLFSLDALSGDSKISSALSTNSASNTGESGGNSSQSTTINNTFAVWTEVGKAIQNVLTEGEKVSLTPTSGKILVSATPDHMYKVASIIKEFNKFYTKLIRLDIKVYQVTQSSADNYGANWAGALQSVSNKLKASVSVGTSLIDGNLLKLDFNNNKNSANAIFQALSSVGKTTLLRTNSIVTLNNQSAPLNVLREQAYLKESKVTTNGTSGVSDYSLVPGVVKEGYSMNITPFLEDKGNILLQIAVDSSTLEAIKDFTTRDNKQSIQLPVKTVNNFLQRAILRNGTSLVMTAFQEVKNQKDNEGVLNPSNWFAGGKDNAKTELKTIVIVVTPYVLN